MNKLLAQYECVRVESMSEVDLTQFRFDFDLTFGLLLLSPDGQIRHTFAGRDYNDAESHLSMSALTSVLQKTLIAHRAAAMNPRSKVATAGKARTVEDFDAYQAKARKKGVPKCVHCHEVHDYMRDDAMAQGRWTRADEWRWPDPRQVGWTLHRDVQTQLTSVLPGSPAAKAGMLAADRLVSIADTRVLTFGDVQRVLEDASGTSDSLPVRFVREGVERRVSLALRADWKTPSPLAFSWRASKWGMSPKPGFGGRALTAAEKKRLGIALEGFAFRVTYIVTWGPSSATGQRAFKAGIRKGDVVVSMNGKSDFHSQQHMHAWFRLTRKPGTTVEVQLWRKGKLRTVRLPVVK